MPCPAGLRELAAGLLAVGADGGRSVHLVPGIVRAAGADGFPDVMRGEETQILGDLAAASRDRELLLRAARHSQQVGLVRRRANLRFATYMTGEVYELLVRHSILGRLMTPGRSRSRRLRPRPRPRPGLGPVPPPAGCCTTCSAPGRSG